MDTTQQTDISKLVGLDSLNPKAREEFLADIGDVVFEAALLRLVADLSEEQGVALDYYLEDNYEMETLIKHLFEHYPQFEKILEEEMSAFRAEVVAMMPKLEEEKQEELQ